MTEPSQYFKGRTVQEQMNEVIGYVDTRAAEVATTAIASDVAQVHQDMLDADADAQAAAASAAAAAGTLANAVKKTGEASQSIAGDIAVAGTLSGGVVTGTVITAPTPVNNTDAANKKYVDDADALKADKTYVDAQDATKISITDINSYAVGLTGNQTKTGILSLQTTVNTILEIKTAIADVTATPSGYPAKDIAWTCVDNAFICRLRFQVTPSGERQLLCFMTDKDGTSHAKVLMSMSIDGVVQ